MNPSKNHEPLPQREQELQESQRQTDNLDAQLHGRPAAGNGASPPTPSDRASAHGRGAEVADNGRGQTVPTNDPIPLSLRRDPGSPVWQGLDKEAATAALAPALNPKPASAYKILFRDYETRSALDLQRVGAWKYSAHPTTDVWCCGYAVDEGPVQMWVPGDPVPPEFIEAANNPNWIVSAFNDQFERHIEEHIMSPRYGWPIIPIERHRCTQAAAQALALPASLAKAAAALGLEQRKDVEGQTLMKQMARPRKPKKGEDPSGVYWFDDVERRLRLYEYCKADVLTERAIHKRIGHLSDAEQSVWILDSIINERGIRIDRNLVVGATNIGVAAQAAIDAELCAVTGGEVSTTKQTEKLIAWLAANGVAIDSVQKETINAALERTDLPDKVRRVLELRRDGAHIAATKFKTMLGWAGTDDRIHGAHKYHQAATGRWASHGVQTQNLKKSNGLDVAAAIKIITSGDLAQMRQHYDHPLEIVGEIVRAAIIAASGHRLIIADFSGIESRVLAFLADEQSKLDLWRQYDQNSDAEHDPYFKLGKQFGFAADVARAKGKIAESLPAKVRPARKRIHSSVIGVAPTSKQ
jgi:DNA polymerase